MKERCVQLIFVLFFWTGCVLTAEVKPTKFLFTAPRNLWQGSEEEFCISFHDKEKVQSDYFLTLTSNDNSFSSVIGNGTAKEEGRVCHHFTVPDNIGRMKLTLSMDTSRQEMGFITEIHREHNTEVEIFASSLETFVQTDKPIYKPGGTVKFRVMTIDRDLKPWTGVVPLVTVKNPGDVRVMQWKDVENKKGLLSFEMALSEDPPLGDWKITVVVEGKENEQAFTVQEYVLPKYEVTVTAPTFLLPTSETVVGTVCAKYTYGKPVKGKVELSVCYTESNSPYYYYYRNNQEERPCATRIMDIDGCKEYSVLGSELYLGSSNYSRYGNLEINATVTELATGISLNGTVTGPEMTFEAVKLKFEDDTHGYFKSAFPYYARVVVTKPDGSPAPGEIVEIKADHYSPDFHLKRNFTSDSNGIIKFAIKKLPQDVNRLSFNARAPKYYEPYGRYHHIVKMYEPRAYHSANKWFSPSNSYIHIPSVEGEPECGSTLDLDVLYSTPPDTDYKFFIQVLSKSHMVYHTHKRHHFKIHDAVNFDNIPEDMLLDPYTPPPRPTYFYPIDNVYDDPELGYKPPAENITITLGEIDEKKNSSSKDKQSVPVPRSKREKTGPCDISSLYTCMMSFSSIGQEGSPKLKDICKAYYTLQNCIEPYRANCEGDVLQSVEQSVEQIEVTYSSMCKNAKCDMMAMSNCAKQIANKPESSKQDLCVSYEKFKTCFMPYEADCKDSEMYKQMTTMIDNYDKLCGKKEKENAKCDMMAMSNCAKQIANKPESSKQDLCVSYEKFKTCFMPYEADCKDSEMYKQMTTMIDNYDKLCGKKEKENAKCDMMAMSNCAKQIANKPESSKQDLCVSYEKFKTCFMPYEADCKDSEMYKQMTTMIDNYDKLCGKKEKEISRLVCTNLYRPYINTTVVPGKEVSVMASSTRTVQKCSGVCTGDDNCRGFVYEPSSGSCELYRDSDYTTKEEEGAYYYERNCYSEVVKESQESSHVAKIKLSIPVRANMGPESQILVYYVREDEETVAATLTFKVRKCFDNKVEMKFDKDSVYPGSDVNINLKASPGSLCSVGVVDKSVKLIGGDNQLTPEQLFSRFKMPHMYTSYWQEDKKYCDRKTHYSKEYEAVGSWHYRSYKSDSVDAIQAFRKMDLVVFSDLTLETRPCEIQEQPVFYNYHGPVPGPMGPNGQTGLGGTNPPLGMPSTISQKQVGLRREFPETLLWSLYVVGDEGEINVKSTIPHTITEWEGNSLCTNLDVGVGVSPVTGITAFQPFFLSFTLPYSAVRGEKIPVLVSIFNYMSECLVMQVAMPGSSDFVLDGSRSNMKCVCSGETRTVKYYITPKTLGKIKILATAESIPDDGTCGNNAVSKDGLGANDAVQRELLIEAEGIEKEYTVNSYICPEGRMSSEEMILPLPPDDVLIEDSARGYINVIGDIMGPALSNLKDLLQMPYGCGEQNMASFSPNIFALQYLTNTNQLLPKIEDEAKGYMRIGYQRQLKYRHSDGSYSAFGGKGSGSIWLTAFVVKCFGQSSPYIDIDVDDVKKSTSWFRSKQLENGCFPKIGYTHSYYLKGGFSDRNNEASLTAFVLISMLEAGVPRSDPSIIKAVRCLDVQDIPDTYTMALMAYAYTLYDLKHINRQKIMAMLEEKATKKDGMKFWTRTEKKEKKEKNKWYYTAVSAEVEITSYALLSYITGEQQNAALTARPVVMWLTKQRNPRGGFSSTQDTVVALQALSRYATLVYQGGVNISIDVIEKGKDSVGQFSIDDDNTLVLQSKPIVNLPTTLQANVSGGGCAMIQANVKYNVDETPKSPTFNMKVSVYRAKDRVDHCGRRSLSICVSFTGPGGVSNMAIVDVKMVTGWIPDKDSLKKLVVDKGSPKYIGIEKYEVDGSYVHIYFDQLDSTRRCFLIDVEQNIELTNPAPAQVKVYDYYETDFTLIVNYKIKTICGTKEELPYLTPEEYDNFDFKDIVQVRVPIRDTFPGRIPRPRPVVGPGSGTMSCPICLSTIDTKSKAFKSMVCGSKKIYKVTKGRKGKFPLKMFADLRPKKKERFSKLFAYQRYDSRCNCDLMGGKSGKILVFQSDNTYYDKATNTLALNAGSKIIKRSKTLEKAIFRLVTKKKCR